ncbi:hypothetical protein Anapl_13022 [Anas platyrhynchos]|uniref:Uncharacterized protein n=1 Tax=Anas platyrhynchos TaxID=8839 RepID=R0LE94_ANAPL|nr:hypothetical protein Anapl_13022 [Anas platyrhynchos]
MERAKPTAASIAVLLEHVQSWLLLPVASILADKGVTLGKDSVRGAEGICSQLEFVHGDILLKACAVWEGGFPEGLVRRVWHGSYEVLREGGVFVGTNLEDVHLLELSVFAVVSLLKCEVNKRFPALWPSSSAGRGVCFAQDDTRKNLQVKPAVPWEGKGVDVGGGVVGSSEMGKEEERPGLFCSPQKSTAVGSYLLLAICVQDPIKLPTEKVTESQLSQCSSSSFCIIMQAGTDRFGVCKMTAVLAALKCSEAQ